jgi:Zinc finger C-x8-C-x5-C-x3-H type (and similar)
MSQQRSPQPCRFFATPGGCRRGTSCHFAHGTTANPTNNSQQHSHRSPSDRRSDSSQNPNGTCRSFWQTGACRFAFDCKYKHVASGSQSQRTTTRDVVVAGATSMPFLSPGGFSRVGSSGSDVFSSIPFRVMDPNEAHNTLKRFLFDDYRFRKTFDVYAFLVPVLSANTNSNLWVSSWQSRHDDVSSHQT